MNSLTSADRATLVALFGTGDCYMTLAFASAAQQAHAVSVRVAMKPEHAAIARMFPQVKTVEIAGLERYETDRVLQRNHENQIGIGRAFFAHPIFIRSGARIDRMAYKASISHAGVWRELMGLPLDAPMERGVPLQRETKFGSVFLIPQARSWPNAAPGFWHLLSARLRFDGWTVSVNDETAPLEQVFAACAEAEWVIGPQCGLMTILTHAGFACRKTFAIPSIDDGHSWGFPLTRTFPYAYVTKFAGEDYDVEEFRVDGDGSEAVEKIARGVNAKRLRRAHPHPVPTVTMALTLGDFFDRLSILSVKMDRFSPDKAAMVRREFDRHNEIAGPLFREYGPPLRSLYQSLKEVNAEVFGLSEALVPDALSASEAIIEAHTAVIRANKERIELKAEINRFCGAAFDEVKSYYG